MRAVLIRTGSAPLHASPVHSSSKISFSDLDSVTGILFTCKNNAVSPRYSLHWEIKDRKKDVSRSIRRALSEPDLIRSSNKVSGLFSDLSGIGSRSFPPRIPEEDEDRLDEDEGIKMILKRKCLDRDNYDRVVGIRPESDTLPEELEFSGGGMGKGRKVGGGNGGGRGGGGGGGDGGGGSADKSKIGAYYQKMLKANPGNPLLLRNYGKFLHEVEKDVVRAAEYYERAILAGPGDGEVLSLYGKLIWEIHRDGGRAKVYFDQAVQASPGDCYVLGSYAQFLWDAEEEEEEEDETEETKTMSSSSSSALVEAF